VRPYLLASTTAAPVPALLLQSISKLAAIKLNGLPHPLVQAALEVAAIRRAGAQAAGKIQFSSPSKRCQSIPVGEHGVARQEAQEAERTMPVLAGSPFPLFIPLGPWPVGWRGSHSGQSSPLVNPLQKHPHRHTGRELYQLQCNQLDIKTDPTHHEHYVVFKSRNKSSNALCGSSRHM
jgi:hypothetical protein